MNTKEKVEFLLKSWGLPKERFLAKFGIDFKEYDNWDKEKPSPKSIFKLCRFYGFSLTDFLNDSTKIIMKESNRHGYLIVSSDDLENVTYEDYPHEDNARYEEKD